MNDHTRGSVFDSDSASLSGTLDEPLLRVENLTTTYDLDKGYIKALDNVSFTLEEGKVLGIVGESGSGKTTLCRSIMRLFSTAHVHTGGSINLAGENLLELTEPMLRRVWGRWVSIVFQDPMTSLSPLMRIGNQVSEGLRIRMSLSRREAKQRAMSILKSVGIKSAKEYFPRYPHQLSGGLRQRVAIAIGVACEPKLLIADEPTTGLDVTIQAQILKLLDKLRYDHKMAIILVTHDVGVAATAADDIAVMYAGRIVEYGPAGTVIRNPLMRYTRALLDTSPHLYHDPHSRLKTIPGHAPDLSNLPAGCPFSTRCVAVGERCHNERPELIGAGDDDTHRYACWHPVDKVGSKTS
ncbi:MAG: ABC transporter ATP-binding protein [Actinobacteria bacterium]|nr:ABC transporter ATP-binding protein [Actinomycetota bacterium]